MNTTPIIAQEGLLLNLIESLGCLEWRKYQQRYPETALSVRTVLRILLSLVFAFKMRILT
jgi:hypothetical protein